MMNKSVFFLYICASLLSVFLAYGAARATYVRTEFSAEHETENEVIDKEKKNEHVDWDLFIEAVIWKESRGNENSVGDNGKAVGVLQIHPIMVREANRILSIKNIDKEYTYDDRYNREKSIEIFKIVQDYHNKDHNIERALQIWNKNHPESYKTQIVEKYLELKSV